MTKILVALWRLAAGLSGMAVDTTAEAVQWLRRPGSTLKAGCAVLAVISLIAGLNSYTRGIQVKELRNRIVFVTTQCKADTAALQADVDERDARLDEIAGSLRAEALKLEALEAEAAAALKGLAERLEEAERQGAAWRERYNARPDTCRAALELLDSACPALEGY